MRMTKSRRKKFDAMFRAMTRTAVYADNLGLAEVLKDVLVAKKKAAHAAVAERLSMPDGWTLRRRRIFGRIVRLHRNGRQQP